MRTHPPAAQTHVAKRSAGLVHAAARDDTNGFSRLLAQKHDGKTIAKEPAGGPHEDGTATEPAASVRPTLMQEHQRPRLTNWSEPQESLPDEDGDAGPPPLKKQESEADRNNRPIEAPQGTPAPSPPREARDTPATAERPQPATPAAHDRPTVYRDPLPPVRHAALSPMRGPPADPDRSRAKIMREADPAPAPAPTAPAAAAPSAALGSDMPVPDAIFAAPVARKDAPHPESRTPRKDDAVPPEPDLSSWGAPAEAHDPVEAVEPRAAGRDATDGLARRPVPSAREPETGASIRSAPAVGTEARPQTGHDADLPVASPKAVDTPFGAPPSSMVETPRSDVTPEQPAVARGPAQLDAVASESRPEPMPQSNGRIERPATDMPLPRPLENEPRTTIVEPEPPRAPATAMQPLLFALVAPPEPSAGAVFEAVARPTDETETTASARPKPQSSIQIERPVAGRPLPGSLGNEPRTTTVEPEPPRASVTNVRPSSAPVAPPEPSAGAVFEAIARPTDETETTASARPKPQSSIQIERPVAGKPLPGSLENEARAIVVEPKPPRAPAAAVRLSSVPVAPSKIATPEIQASKPNDKPLDAIAAQTIDVTAPSAPAADPEPIDFSAPGRVPSVAKAAPSEPKAATAMARPVGPGETRAEPVVAMGAPPAIDVQPQPRQSAARTVPKAVQAAAPASSLSHSPEPAGPALENKTPLVAQPTAGPQPKLPATPVDEHRMPAAPPATTAPSFATEVTMAAARYSLPSSDRRFERVAFDAPVAMPASRPAQVGLSASPRPGFKQGFPSSVIAPDRAGPMTQPAGDPIDAVASSVDASLYGSPSSDGKPSLEAAEQATPTSAASPAPAVAQSPAPVAVQTVAASPSPAMSVAAAIIPEPTWRPAPVADATQVATDRTPGAPATLSIQLDPGDLGVVTATLSMAGTRLQVGLTTRSAEAHERLKAESHTIEKAMRALGYEVGEIVITQSLVVPGGAAGPETPPSTLQAGGRDAQPSGSQDAFGGNRPPRQNGERNGHGASSGSGSLVPHPADHGGGGIYI